MYKKIFPGYKLTFLTYSDKLQAFPIFFKINTIPLTLRNFSSSRIKFCSEPSTYVLNDKLQREKGMILIEEFEEDLKNISGKCMDVGCGPGDVTKEIILPALHSNAVVIGTDISQNMIEYANRTYSIKKRLEFEVLDIQTKNLPTKYVSEFDFVSSFHALNWCTDIRQAFENIYRMLRPNGTMLIILVASYEIITFLENMTQDVRFAPYIKDVNKYIPPFQKSIKPRKELKELLQKLGFKVIHCSHRDEYYLNEDMNHFFVSILSFYKFIDDMPSKQKEEFKKEFIHRLTEKLFRKQTNDNTMILLNTYKTLIVCAQKYVP